MNTLAENVVLLRNDSFVHVQADLHDRTITLKWTGYAPSTVFRSILDDAAMNVALHGITRWLADLRQMNAILRQDEQWTVTDWFPRLATAGLKRMAILTSTDYFNQMSVDRIMSGAAPILPFEVAYFDDVDAAHRWLQADPD